MRILIVEDDDLIARGIASGLRAYGLAADTVPTAAQAELALANAACDAMCSTAGFPTATASPCSRACGSAARPFLCFC